MCPFHGWRWDVTGKNQFVLERGEFRGGQLRASDILGMWGGEIFIFPNFLILPQAGNTEFYRSRPDKSDPDKCIFEIWSSKTYPAAVKPPRATVQRVTNLSAPQQLLRIPRQDLSNIPRIQKGLHSRGIRQTRLAAQQESLILNMHQQLDRYLGM